MEDTSSNGTMHNHRRLSKQSVILSDGDTIEVGYKRASDVVGRALAYEVQGFVYLHSSQRGSAGQLTQEPQVEEVGQNFIYSSSRLDHWLITRSGSEDRRLRRIGQTARLGSILRSSTGAQHQDTQAGRVQSAQTEYGLEAQPRGPKTRSGDPQEPLSRICCTTRPALTPHAAQHKQNRGDRSERAQSVRQSFSTGYS